MQGEGCSYIELLIFGDSYAFEQFLFCVRSNNINNLDGAVTYSVKKDPNFVNVNYPMK